MRPELLEQVKETVRHATGILIGEQNSAELAKFIAARLPSLRLSEGEYAAGLAADYREIVSLASAFTVQETSFYRYKEHYDRLKLQILPELIRRKQREKRPRILVLSAGCATGEEPYTIGMIIHDLLKDCGEWNVRIVASDINADALAQAREGAYSEYKLRNIDQWYVYRYFDQAVNKAGQPVYRLKSFIKSMVEYRQVNLSRDPFELADLADVDIIFCENVIIYLSIESIQRLIGNFYRLLAPGGLLFLGSSETLNIIQHQFQLTWWNESFAYRKPAPPAPEAQAVPAPPAAAREAVGADEAGAPIPYPEFIYLILQSFESELYDMALTLLSRLEKSGLELTDVFHLIKAEYLYENRQYIPAADECRRALGLNQQSAEAHLLLGAIYLDLGMHDNARFEIKTALYLEPASVLGYYYLGRYYGQCGNATEKDYCLAYAKHLLEEQGSLAPSKIFPLYRSRRDEICQTIAGAGGRRLGAGPPPPAGGGTPPASGGTPPGSGGDHTDGIVGPAADGKG